MDILIWIMIIACIVIGLSSIAACTLGIPAVFVWKIYRRIRYKIPLTK